jgi:A nuclease family of the HNH/ENDO VII superfamily with conserved AHH
MKILKLRVNQMLLLFFCTLMLFSCKKETIETINENSLENPFQITVGVKTLIKEKLTTNDFDNINWNSTVIKTVPNTEFKIIQIAFASENEANSTFFAVISLNSSNDYIKGRIVKIKATSFDSLHEINGKLYEANLDRTNEENFDIVSGKKVTNTSSIRIEPSITMAEWYYLLDGLGIGYSIYTGTSGGSSSSGPTGPGANTSGGTANNAPPATTYTFLSLFLTNQLQLNLAQKDWLNTHPTLAMDIFDALGNDEMPVGNIPVEEIQASKITIDVAMAGQINGTYDVNHFNNYVAPNLTPVQTPTIIIPNYLVNFLIQCAEIREEHPEWSNARIYWHATVELLHNALDIVGMIPGAGEVADLANGIIYTIQGDGVNASFSYAATIPIYGWFSTTAKWAKKSITALNGTRRTLKWFKQANGLITFGERSLLRRVLGLAVGDLRQAHHLIPWEHWNSLLVQKAAHGNFHLNEILNGIPLTAIQHNGSHNIYNDLVESRLGQLWAQNGGPNMTNATAEALVRDLDNQIRNWIVSHPNQSINNLILP